MYMDSSKEKDNFFFFFLIHIIEFFFDKPTQERRLHGAYLVHDDLSDLEAPPVLDSFVFRNLCGHAD